MNLDDTIVAVSSPPGAARRGIVRLSGPEALTLAWGVFTPSSQSTNFEYQGSLTAEAAANQQDPVESGLPLRVEGHCRVGAAALPAAAYVFRAPRSYTRQDLVELHLLGAPGVLALLVESLLAAGARRAEPGEFTARAFLAGAMDLGQVHGVAAMIHAGSDRQLRAAQRLLHGSLSLTAHAAREELAELLSLVEGALDFADEPIEFIAPVELRRRLTRVAESLRRTADAGLAAERWGRWPHVVLVGLPNAGKSSLLNRLAGVDRAISAPVPGTTRDVLTAPLDLGETQVVLVDVAGLRDAGDALDAAAQAAAAQAVREADLVLHVIDSTTLFVAERQAEDVPLPETPQVVPPRPREVAADQPLLTVLNKIDLLSPSQRDALAGMNTLDRAGAVQVSAVTGEGCDALRGAIEAALADRSADATDDSLALVVEHREALAAAVAAVERAAALAAGSGDSLADADLVAVELHAAAEALGVLVGQDLPDDLLGRIFARFCVGK